MQRAIIINKNKTLNKYKSSLLYDLKINLCYALIQKKITSKNKRVLLYKPRLNLSGSVICHLGEAHLEKNAKGKIIDFLEDND